MFAKYFNDICSVKLNNIMKNMYFILYISLTDTITVNFLNQSKIRQRNNHTNNKGF